MQLSYQSFANITKWSAEDTEGQSRVPLHLRSLVLDRGSLTTALISLSNDHFNVNVLRETIEIPKDNEAEKLDEPAAAPAMVREVELCVYNTPVVYARSVIPATLVQSEQLGLSNLGNKPLGQLLFKDGQIQVSQRELCSFESQGHEITARRTPYSYLGCKILVAEYFLPSLDAYLI